MRQLFDVNMFKALIYGMILTIFTVSCSMGISNQAKKDLKPSGEQLQVGDSVDGKDISKMLVGTNLWYKNPTDEIWRLTEQSGVTAIRIGGHAYDKELPSNTTLIRWVKKIQSIGAEPILQVSQYATPNDAAELVKLFNVDLVTGKPITYWNIGNEPWLQNNKPDLSKVGDLVEAYFKPCAEAMKEIDKTIKIYGPDLCYYMDEAIDDLFGGKNDITGKIPGKDYYYCDGLSWHRYPQDNDINLAYEGVEDFKRAIIKSKQKVDSVNNLHGRMYENALGWGIGEFNAKGGPQVHTWENGQMFGAILGLCMKYEATYATSWSMFEHNGDRKGTDFGFIDGNMTPRPSYRIMQMIATNFSGKYLEGKSTSSDIITFGSIDEENSISVMIINRAKTLSSFNLNLSYKNEKTSGGVTLNINADNNLSHSGVIEGLATHVYTFRNGKTVRTIYTNSNFINEEPPETQVL